MDSHKDCWHTNVSDLSVLKSMRKDAKLLISEIYSDCSLLIDEDDSLKLVVDTALKCLVEQLDKAEAQSEKYISIFPKEYRSLLRATLSGHSQEEFSAELELLFRRKERREKKED